MGICTLYCKNYEVILQNFTKYIDFSEKTCYNILSLKCYPEIIGAFLYSV